MVFLPAHPNLRDFTLAAIRSGREVHTLLESSTLDFGRDDRAVTQLMDRLDKERFFDPDDDLLLAAIASHACALIGKTYPTWTQSLQAGRIPEEPFFDLDAELARRLLEAVGDFRRMRQRVHDELLCDRLLIAMQRGR